LIPIRLGSERLPNKALKEICGRPVVWHLLDRVCASRRIRDKKDVVVCTTRDPSDQPLVDSVERYGCSVFRGERDDIIKRFGDAIAHYGFDAVIQVDGDDPLTDTAYMDRTMDALLEDPAKGIVVSEGLPLGVNSKSFTRAAMQRVISHYRTEKNDTGFIYFFTRTGLFNAGTVGPMNPDHVLDAARLTLDYDEDLEVFTRIFEALYEPGKVFGVGDFVAYLKTNPDVMEINSQLDEEYWRRTQEQAQLEFEASDGTLEKIT
jgi:spore coat polysaccharide biosynthesis protein SpsF